MDLEHTGAIFIISKKAIETLILRQQLKLFAFCEIMVW